MYFTITTSAIQTYRFNASSMGDVWGNITPSSLAPSDVTLTISNNTSNSAPTFTSESIFSAPENQKEIGTVTATDADGDTITYTISGSDITINSSSGIIAFASSPNYENKSTYTATISASDGIVSTSQDITVNITDKNDAPTATAASYYLNLYLRSIWR